MKKFVISCDGFVRYERPMTFEEAKVDYWNTIRNRYLYEYDVSIYELDQDGKISRRVSFEELKENK